MELTALKASIKTAEFINTYIFTGPEIGVMHIYLKQMAKVLKCSIKTLDSVVDWASKMNSSSILSQKNVQVFYEAKEFIDDEKLRNAILSRKFTTGDIVVFVFSALDKRTKLYKNHQNIIVEFNAMRKDVLKKYIAKEIDLSEQNADSLIEICDSDYSRILLEIDKIRQYSKCTGEGSNQSYRTLIKTGAIYTPAKDAIFDFVDAVLRYKTKLAFQLLQECYECGESTMVILSNLYNSTKQLLQVQSYEGDNITSSTGLTPFQIKLATGRKNIYSNGDLVYLMKLVRNVEKGIKTGEVEEPFAVPYILVNFW